MDRTQFIIATVEAIRRRAPALTMKQAAAIAERIAKGEDSAVMPLWELKNGDLAAEYVRVGLDALEAAAPELWRTPPTRDQFLSVEEAKFSEKMGRKWFATEKLTAARAAAELTADDLLERIPHGTALPEPSKVTQLSQPASPKADDVASLDAEVEKRFGKTVHQISAGDRRRYHDLIKADQRRTDSAERNRDAALASADNDFSQLPPAERMSRFRAAEKAKASNRP